MIQKDRTMNTDRLILPLVLRAALEDGDSEAYEEIIKNAGADKIISDCLTLIDFLGLMNSKTRNISKENLFDVLMVMASSNDDSHSVKEKEDDEQE